MDDNIGSEIVNQISRSYAPSPLEIYAAEQIAMLQKLLQEEKEISDALFVSLVNHGYNDDDGIFRKANAIKKYKKSRQKD